MSRAFEEFVPYLLKRATEDGIVNAVRLYAELRERGHPGSRRTVRHYLEPRFSGREGEVASIVIGSVPVQNEASKGMITHSRCESLARNSLSAMPVHVDRWADAVRKADSIARARMPECNRTSPKRGYF